MELFETLFPFGVEHYLIGGILIGSGVSLLFISTGLVGGMSSVFTTALSYVSKASFFQEDQQLKSRQWRFVYAAGLILGAFIWILLPANGVVVTQLPWWQLAVGGFIAGFGARYGDGCTSGHGICGMASLNLPSFVSVIVFLSTAIITAQIISAVIPLN
ncbi:MAG: YeeE/YedE family protein [Pseudomonadales bacterium]|nr:YeeE/YedE family protein [Pseudomonadales bacterium]